MAFNPLQYPGFLGAPQQMRGLLNPDQPMGGGIGQGLFPSAPQPGGMQPMQPQPAGGGFGDMFGSLFGGGGGEPNEALMALGQGLYSRDMGSAMQGLTKAMQGTRQRKATAQFLLQRGIAKDPQEADLFASNPALINLVMKGDELVNAGDGNLYNKTTGEWIQAPGGGMGKPTDDMREYEAARAQGFDGTFMDWQIKMKEAGRNQIDINTGEKLPTGFRWIDPNNKDLGVQPIPGGPGEQIPGELAARVGVADSFLAQLPSIKTRVKQGKVTGVLDRAKAGAGYGESAALYNDIETGADVLQRFLTGAGMPASEAADYVRRYKPTYMDTEETVLGKLDRLERELRAAKEMAMRGRGGSTGAPAAGGGTTSTGVPWSVEP